MQLIMKPKYSYSATSCLIRSKSLKGRMKQKIRCIAIIFLFFFFVNCNRDTLLSPNGNIEVKTRTGDSIGFVISFKGETVLNLSSIDFTFKSAQPFGSDLKISEVRTRVIDESWEPILRTEKTVFNHCNEMIYTLIEKNEPYRKVHLTVRAYDDGVAYMIEFFGSGTDTSLIIKEENNVFNFRDDHYCWAADYGDYNSSFESEFIEYQLSEISDQMVIGLPVTVKINEGLYLALTEAMLVDYAGMYLKPAKVTSGFGLRSQLAPLPGQDEKGEKVRIKLPHKTPWRVIMIGETPGSLIESNIIVNLNEPCKLKDVSWINPGMCAWDHWWSGDVNAKTEVIKEYIDLAADMGWPYQLIDWQWYGVPRTSELFIKDSDDITKPSDSINMPEVLEYAKMKGVRCWLWLHWRDLNRHNMDTVFALYESWGIAGVKIDFMNRDDQEMVNWYREVIETAAKYHLMVNFHSSYKPTGIRRTFPNLLTREGVLGNEYNKESNRVTPEHMVTIPYTRMLAGPMDFTPGGFLNRSPMNFRYQPVPATVQGTRCNTLAQFVVYESPLTIACDHPKHYRNAQGIDFLKLIPTVWDQTKVISGSIGEFILIARKSGDNWFVAAMNNNIPRVLDADFTFLDEGDFQMISYADAADTDLYPERLVQSETNVNRNSFLKISMAVGGGFAAFLSPVKQQ